MRTSFLSARVPLPLSVRTDLRTGNHTSHVHCEATCEVRCSMLGFVRPHGSVSRGSFRIPPVHGVCFRNRSKPWIPAWIPSSRTNQPANLVSKRPGTVETTVETIAASRCGRRNNPRWRIFRCGFICELIDACSRPPYLCWRAIQPVRVRRNVRRNAEYQGERNVAFDIG